MNEPKLLSPSALAAIRARDERDQRTARQGWTQQAANDRRALLGHLDALQAKPELPRCGHCGEEVFDPAIHRCAPRPVPKQAALLDVGPEAWEPKR